MNIGKFYLIYCFLINLFLLQELAKMILFLLKLLEIFNLETCNIILKTKEVPKCHQQKPI